MRHLLLTTASLLLGHWACAQVDRVDQPSLGSYYYAQLLASDSTWWFVGQEEVSNTFLSQAILRGMNEDGEVVHQQGFYVPGYELAYFTDIAELPDGSLILSGVASYGCDFGVFETFVVRYAPDTLHWQRTFAMEHGSGIAVGDSTIELVGGLIDPYVPVILTIDHHGDSLYSTPSNVGGIYGLIGSEQGPLVFGSEGISRLLSDGTPGDHLAVQWVSRAMQRANGTVLIVTNDSMLVLDQELHRTGLGRTISLPYNAVLLEDGDDVLIITPDSLVRLGPELNPTSVVPLDQPEGYAPENATLVDDLLVTSGVFYCGAASAAVNALSLSTPTALPTDVALRGLSLDSSNVHQVWGQNGAYITGQFWVSGWLVNQGDLQVDEVMIDQVIPYGICTYAGYQYPYSDLALAPGDSVLLSTGPFSWYGYGPPGDTATREFCIWASTPDQRMDRDRSNNEACVDVHVLVGIAELAQEMPPAVFPNPTTGQITVDLSAYPGIRANIALLDASGRTVHAFGPVQGGGLFSTDLNAFPLGVYMLRIDGVSAQWTLRVVRI